MESTAELTDYLYFHMAKAVAMTASRRGDREAFMAVRSRLRATIMGVPMAICDRILFARVLRMIAKHIGGFRARLWAELVLPR